MARPEGPGWHHVEWMDGYAKREQFVIVVRSGKGLKAVDPHGHESPVSSFRAATWRRVSIAVTELSPLER